ncbi:Gldg family protein [Pseudobacteriovorax antillogorgiicola]|uniref:ABC-type uncharacterized transport system involved in gliding motility, auxiliary component n=1 Tax=Pseudobacteriovorax antillogorgiicola TaxID=1513793 RepID=A0A1Y6B813_9BACT|nr:Gldg family protein [Pseudobacteriovorax antillogorgiicola]TCS59348.1 ABC-type uncharacterized transport system involved in gliding motility auxiliary subunit [Pseudobacteriovorax antillogorgiicola]SME89099.1 ABC-type uncharacterized transport system involved in gliding motility, auxiliary component [Pseudobacteriovorax antillogorgiicola]
MKSKLLILPFLSIFSVAMAVLVGSTMSDIPWLSHSLWGLAAALIAAWIVAEKDSIQQSFAVKGARYGMSTGLTVVLGLVIIVGVGFLSTRARFNQSFDVTRDGINTLSDQSLKMIEKFDESNPITVLTFFDDDMKKTEFTQLLDLYLGAGLPAQVEHIDPKAEPTRALAENVTTVDTVILKLADQNNRLTDFTEEKLTNGFLKLLKQDSKKVYFTLGHGERDLENQEAEGYRLIKDELVSERYEVATVNLLEAGKVPDDADIVVVAGPKYDFRETEIALLDAHLAAAKPVLVLVDAMTNVPNLQKLMENYGLKVDNNMLILRPDDPRAQLLGQNNALITEFDEFSPATKDLAAKGAVTLVAANSRSISESVDNDKGMKPTLVAKTADIIIAVDKVTKPQDLEDIGPDRIVGGPFAVLGVAVGQIGGEEIAENSRKSESTEAKDVGNDKLGKAAKELRVGVVGSSDLVTNLGVQRGENVDMFLNMVNYLLQDEDFISIRPKDLTESRLDVSSASSQLLLLFFAYIYPTVFLGGGIFYWVRRRRA